MNLLAVAGIILAVFALWFARALLVPYTRCWWCSGTGRNWFSGKRRHGDCWFCHGARRRPVLGAKTAQQMWLAWRGKDKG